MSAIRDVDSESLADMSNEAVDKLVRRVKGRGSSGKKKQDNRLQCDSAATVSLFSLMRLLIFSRDGSF